MESSKQDEVKVFKNFLDVVKVIKNVKGSVAILTRSNSQALRIIDALSNFDVLGVPKKEALLEKLAFVEEFVDALKLFYKNPTRTNALALKKFKRYLPSWLVSEIKKSEEVVNSLFAGEKIELKESYSAVLRTALEKMALSFAVSPKKLLKLYKVYEKGGKRKVVVVDTIHAVKGMEFDYVFLLDAIPSLVREEIEHSIKAQVGELETLYVAVTRARKFLGIIKTHVSYFNRFQIPLET